MSGQKIITGLQEAIASTRKDRPMSNDLKARLRDGKLTWGDRWEAADRIEALEAALAAMTAERDARTAQFEAAATDRDDYAMRYHQASSELVASEARLAKAVEALRLYADEDGYDVDLKDYGLSLTTGPTIIDGGERARATLAEIGGA